MTTPAQRFPVRPRRMRRDEFSRRLMREHVLTTNDLIYPVFVHEEPGRAPVGAMPGVERLSIDELLRVGEQALELGVPMLDLFGVPNHATLLGVDVFFQQAVVVPTPGGAYAGIVDLSNAVAVQVGS